MSNYPRIVATPPGPKAREALKRDYFLLSPSNFHLYPLVIDSAIGSMIRDIDGNEYIDFNSFSCVINIGHSHTKVLEAIQNQARRLLHCDQALYHEASFDLAEALIKIVPGPHKKRVLYSVSGSEAIEASIKLVKWHTRRNCFLTFTGAYHGSTYGALSLSGTYLARRRHFHPMLGGVVHAPYPHCHRCPFKQKYPACNYWCIDFIEDNIIKKYLPHEEIAGVFFEPIQWLDGCIIPPPEYFRRLKKLADKCGLLLIDDEAYTGMGRTGRWLGIEHWKIYPDVVCMGGALASGLPLGAVVSRADVMDWEPNSHSSPLGGNPLTCIAALKVIEALREENLIERGSRMGNYILKNLKEIKEEYSIIDDVRGKGLMIGIEFVKNKEMNEPNLLAVKQIALESWKRGLVVGRSAGSTLLISPPLSIPRELINKGLEILESSIAEVDGRNSI